jgi:hypothetical protein
VEDQPEVETLLKAASLQQEDLPEGYTLDEEGFTTNEESAAETSGSGEPTLEDLNRFGRILSYNANYSQAELSLYVETTLYEDSDGADEALEFVRDLVTDPEYFEFEESGIPGLEIGEPTISDLSMPELGDKRLAFEVKVSAHATELDQDFDYVAQTVGILRGRMIGAIVVLAFSSETPSGEDLEDLARALDERMKDALE